MSHVDLKEGVYYPKGGIWKIADALYQIAAEQKVEFSFDEEVIQLEVEQKKVTKLVTTKKKYQFDLVLSSADYPHTENKLLAPAHQTYSQKYWAKKVMAPSMFLIFLGLKEKIPGLAHHNFYFPADWDKQFAQIFDKPAWPDDPAYYIGTPSVTDPSVAPPGKELLFLLVPVAVGLNDPEEFRKQFRDKIVAHFSKIVKVDIEPLIEIEKVFSHRDFISAYHAYKGTALGLAHTLFQTAIFRPALKSKKVKNLYYAGQYSHPGIGLPMAFIAAKIISNKIEQENHGQ
jgi:phytoene desaturase